MAILNTNEITLEDSNLTLESSVIIGHHFSGVSKENAAELSMQTAFYLDVDKWKADFRNKLKVIRYGEDKRILKFQYPADAEEGIFYFFDLKLKAHLLASFPEWDADKLVITTATVEESIE